MQQNSKKIMWVAVPVVIIVAAISFLWAKSPSGKKVIQNFTNKNTSSENNLKSGPVGGSQTVSTSQDNTNYGNDQNAQYSSGDQSPDEKRSNEQADETLRQQTIAYVNQNLNKLAAPPKNDQWDVPTFYFVGNSNVYVELYAVDTDLAGLKLLYKVEKNTNGLKLAEIARYTEGEEDWILSQGKDEYSDYVMEEYDLNEDNNKWEKTDEFSGSDYSDAENVSEEVDAGGIMP
ncbi:MAG: hypothetical protein V1690_02705 [Candidatus Moraniibacteriota bacterium]